MKVRHEKPEIRKQRKAALDEYEAGAGKAAREKFKQAQAERRAAEIEESAKKLPPYMR